jgi:hypothetical protein
VQCGINRAFWQIKATATTLAEEFDERIAVLWALAQTGQEQEIQVTLERFALRT